MIRSTGRKTWITVLVVLLMGISAYLGTKSRKIDLKKVRPLDGSTMTVVPGVHLLGGLGPAAAYAVETSDGLVLIDAGLEADAQRLKSEMSKLGIDWKKLRAIFLTHVHGDHCGGAERLRAETGARVYAGFADAPILAAGEPRDAFFSTYKMPGHSTHRTTVDVTLLGHEFVSFGHAQFGDTEIEVLNAPGHTTGSTCYLMQRAGLRILFSGDVIYRLGNKPLGTYSTYLAPRYRGDANAYLDTLRRMIEMPVPDLVLPGHPNASGGPQSPRLSQQEWKAIFETGIEEMERLISRFRADGANFLDDHPKQLLPDLFYLGDFQSACVYGFFSNSRFFLVDAPGGPGLNEFIKSQLREMDHETTEPFAILLTACGEKETAGLNSLLEQNRIQVIAPSEGVDKVKKLCPPGTTVISADELKNKEWFPVTQIELGGSEVARTAYLVKFGDKTALFSGRIPVMIDTQSPDELASLLPTSRRNAFDYLVAIRKLGEIQPTLWLPASSENGQNANLYENTWKTILERNTIIANKILKRGQ